MADELPSVEKVSISGATLASLLQRFASSHGDVDGLLFGHLSPLPPPPSHDDDPPVPSSSSSSPSPSPSPSPFSASITGLFSSGSPMSFYDPLGRVDLPSLRRDAAASATSVVGWFSARRRSPLRPSMRELAVSLSLSQTPTLTLPADGSPPPDPRPCVFLLLSSSATSNLAVHTHEYRAFVLRPDPSGGSLVPRSLDVINVGPAFRAQYGSFSPESALPWMPYRPRGAEEKEGDRRGKRGESLSGQRRAATEQRMLDAVTEGFGVERLEKLVGPAAAEYTSQLEDLYGKMLLKLESLARQVEKSSARVLEQENRNLLMRSKLAGLE